MAQLKLKIAGPDFEIEITKTVKVHFEVDPLFADAIEIYFDDAGMPARCGWLDLDKVENNRLLEMVKKEING